MPLRGIPRGYRAYRLPRQGHGVEECQDAWAADAERGRFAVADGAAESPYSSLWARLLVEEFVRQSERLPSWGNWLPSLQERWTETIALPPTPTLPHKGGGRRVASSPLVGEGWGGGASSPSPLVGEGRGGGSSSPSPLVGEGRGGGESVSSVPWYLEAGLNQGAFATFLGLAMEEKKWYSVAVGDSCLFQMRQDEMIRAFPLTRATDFSNAPWLVGSRTSPIEVPHKNGLQQMGECEPGDRFFLMTDALAQWFLIQAESGRMPWQVLCSMVDKADDASAEDAFAAWVAELRGKRQLRNDDVTLVAVFV